MKPETRTTLSSIKDTSYGNALEDFIQDYIEKIGDIRNCQSWEETLGRKYALQLLKDIFSFLEPKPNKINKGDNPYI